MHEHHLTHFEPIDAIACADARYTVLVRMITLLVLFVFGGVEYFRPALENGGEDDRVSSCDPDRPLQVASTTSRELAL